tara:strand:+ start:227 stop:916 length:690 start_codon:yes stop_codon:yes gene_type:complete
MTQEKSLLTIGDDELLRQILVEQLQLNKEYAVTEAETGKEAIYYTQTKHIDAILLDTELKDIDAYELCGQMRATGVAAPIIILSENQRDLDTIRGLDAGANDFIPKPIKIDVLLARLRAHIRQYEQSEHAVFKFARYSFRPGARVLIDNDTQKETRLTDKETEIIKFLYRSNGKVVSKIVLLDEVWGYNVGMTTHTLETHIYRLRQKIEKDPSSSQILVTESNGYRLVI